MLHSLGMTLMLRVPLDGDWYFSMWHASLHRPARKNPLPEGEPCIIIYSKYKLVFSLPAESLFSCLRLLGTQEARPNTTAHVWALAVIRGTFSGGSKSQVTTGRHSEHVEPSRPVQTHKQIKKVSDGSSDILDRQCRQTLLGVGKAFPRH